jgi:hypothetical protein
LKKGTYFLTFSGITYTAVREFSSDLRNTLVKRYGYKFASFLLPGLYTVTKWSKVRAIGITLYNLGGTIRKGELTMIPIRLYFIW